MTACIELGSVRGPVAVEGDLRPAELGGGAAMADDALLQDPRPSCSIIWCMHRNAHARRVGASWNPEIRLEQHGRHARAITPCRPARSYGRLGLQSHGLSATIALDTPADLGISTAKGNALTASFCATKCHARRQGGPSTEAG